MSYEVERVQHRPALYRVWNGIDDTYRTMNFKGLIEYFEGRISWKYITNNDSHDTPPHDACWYKGTSKGWVRC